MSKGLGLRELFSREYSGAGFSAQRESVREIVREMAQSFIDKNPRTMIARQAELFLEIDGRLHGDLPFAMTAQRYHDMSAEECTSLSADMARYIQLRDEIVETARTEIYLHVISLVKRLDRELGDIEPVAPPSVPDEGSAFRYRGLEV